MQRLASAIAEAGPDQSVAEFLLARPDQRLMVQRAQAAPRHAYMEIRDNLIGRDCLPIDMLRCKLAFFGATRFDPRSDRWTRITLFQGAPTRHDLSDIGLVVSGDGRMNVSLNELMGALAKAAIGAGWPHGPARDFAEAAACADAPDWAAIVTMLERPAVKISGGSLTNAPAILSMPSAVDMVQAKGQSVTLSHDDFAGLAVGYARARGHIAIKIEANGAVTFAPGDEGPVRPATRS